MKKGTALGATLAAVVGVSSGIVAVRNTHGEIRVPAGSTATATAAAAPKLSAESQTRIRLLETERTTIARRVKDDLTQLQELDRREKELESATPPPKKASKGDSMKALVSVNLRLEAKRDAANFQKILGLTDEQTARLEELSVKLWSDIFGGAIAETLSIEDLERVTSAKESYEQAFREFLTEEQRRKLTASGMLFGPPEFKPPVSAYEALLKDLDPETQARAKREMSRVVMAANTLFTRAHCLKTGLEFAELLDELVPRYEVRMKQILPADRAASLEAILRQLTIAARKKMENSDGKK